MRTLRNPELLVLCAFADLGCAGIVGLDEPKQLRSETGAVVDSAGSVDTGGSVESGIGPDVTVDAAQDVDPIKSTPALLLYTPPVDAPSGRVAVLSVDGSGVTHVLEDKAGYNQWSQVAASDEYIYFHAPTRGGQAVTQRIGTSVVDLFVKEEPIAWDSSLGLPDRRFLVYQKVGCLRVMRFDPPTKVLENEFASCKATWDWGLQAATFGGLILYGKVGVDDAWIGRYDVVAKTTVGERVVPFGSFVTAAAVGEGFVALDPKVGVARHFDAARIGRPIAGLPYNDFRGLVGLRDGRLVVYRGDQLDVGSLVDDGKGGFAWKLVGTSEAPKSAPRWNNLTAL